MKVADYIVDFLIDKNITDVFGYPGGMVTHLIDAFSKKQDKIKAHVNYNEQGAAFAACGYAQVSLKPGVAYATSGPGATNLITGLCNAYFDSVPVIYITGQVNTYEAKGDLLVRQKGFQETDIVSMVKSVTKYAVLISDINEVRYHLEKAYSLCLEGRPGPVLLDIPMDIQRGEITPESLRGYTPDYCQADNREIKFIIQALEQFKRPCILAGAGIRQSGMRNMFRSLVDYLKIPVVASMIAVDSLQTESPYNFGFAGAYGCRYANYILSKCDLLITLGTRLDSRLTGANLGAFAANAKIIRVDVDENELSNKIKPDETQVVWNLKALLPLLVKTVKNSAIDFGLKFKSWAEVCTKIKTSLEGRDNLNPNNLMQRISIMIPDNSIIMTDVGQNQVWAAQSFYIKKKQHVFFTGGHGSMGYSLPASIGAYYASHGKRIFSINGDGGIQMNIQELQYIAREKIPITIIIFNNKALGMIRHFQEMYFNSNYSQTIENSGYKPPEFSLIAKAYGMEYDKIENVDQVHQMMFKGDKPRLIEVVLNEKTYVFPKLAVNKPINDQEPPIDRELYRYIMEL
ncbi:MAG: thiamine pyrophosphate-binding protein [Christensenellales bacterium]